jgi:Tannase and feruloyl esterase
MVISLSRTRSSITRRALRAVAEPPAEPMVALTLARLWQTTCGIVAIVCLSSWAGTVHAVNLTAVPAIVNCADLLSMDFSAIPGATTKLDTATVVSTGAPQPYCDVKGYIAPNVHFEFKLPTQGWTQRLITLGCGGYCGSLILSFGTSPGSADGCQRVISGELAVAVHDGGHIGAQNFAQILPSIADGAWAINDPQALVDFFYSSNHKTTLAVKAIMKAYYGQAPTYSYFDGCSSGGRAALHVAQRYPNDYDGILAGSPTIDNTSENTFLHAWNVRVNSNPDGTSILTSDKIPALHAAVLSACADSSGMLTDPRTCHFNATAIVCAGPDGPSCLTPAQARVANLIWQGPVDENGRLLSPGDQPYGTELAWAGSIALDKGVVFNGNTSSEFAFSNDFPNYMAKFSPTGITNRNIQFTSSQFTFLDTMSHLNDPTNPDLSAFAAHGGKLVMWDGWADQGTSPFGTLNYYDAVRKQLGAAAASGFMALYMLPGVYHCAGAPNAALMDFLTPLMSWVEDHASPGRTVISYLASGDASSAVTRTRPVYPYPANTAYTGQGSVNDAANYVSSPPTQGVSDVLDWAGLMHYTPAWQWWCSSKGSDTSVGSLDVTSCGPQTPTTP